MAELLRGRRRGWLPLAGFEYLWHTGSLSLRVWVPGAVTRVMVAGVAGGSSDTAVAMARFGVTHAGGFLSVSGGRDWLPMRTDHKDVPRGRYVIRADQRCQRRDFGCCR